MSGFIRPEARAALWKWRDVLAGGGIVIMGAFMMTARFTLLQILGLLIICAGVTFAANGLRRVRFPSRDGGAGVVEVTERQITYYGPNGGGAVALSLLSRIEIMTTATGPLQSDLFWHFIGQDGTDLTIPGDAENVEALFDALAPLNGVDYAAATQAAGSVEPALFLIWERENATHHPAVMH